MKEVIQTGLVTVPIAFLEVALCSFFVNSLDTNISSYSNSANVAFATSVDDIYVFSFSNKSGNDEVMFKSSTDGGLTFSNTIGLVNSTIQNPKEVEISANNNNIIISWSETNASDKENLNDTLPNNGVALGIVLLRLQNESSNTLNQ